MNNAYDVIVIGAGIMGCSSAYQLAKKGLRVAILEKGSIGDGSTGESSAIIRQHYSNPLTAKMAYFSLKIFQNFDEQIGGESGFTETGVAILVGEKDSEGLDANITMQQSVGIRTRLLSAQDLKQVMPGISVTEDIAAAYEPEGGYADPYLTVNSYARAAAKLGVEILRDTMVTDILFEGEKVVGVKTSALTFSAPKVLNTTGAWSSQVARMAGVELPIDACRVQVAFFRRPDDAETSHPVIADFIHASYFRAETGNQTLAGLIDPAEANAIVDPNNFNKKNDYDYVLDMGERLVKRYPIIERSESTGGYASLYAITPDWHPIVDEAPAGSGFYICAGFSGHGFKLGPAVGVMVAGMITAESDPLFDPALFRLSRFAENDQVRGQYEYSIIG